MTPLVLHNGITEEAYLKRFPRPYQVEALTPWQAQRLGMDPEIQLWTYLDDFVYNSDRFGAVTSKKGKITDFGSIPSKFRGIIDDNSPTILRPSGPHDELFGNGGVTDSGRILTFRECNELMAEAMWWCGARRAQVMVVFDSLMIGGRYRFERNKQ